MGEVYGEDVYAVYTCRPIRVWPLRSDKPERERAKLCGAMGKQTAILLEDSSAFLYGKNTPDWASVVPGALRRCEGGSDPDDLGCVVYEFHPSELPREVNMDCHVNILPSIQAFIAEANIGPFQ